MPAQTNATINQNMNDRQSDMDFINDFHFCITKKQGDAIIPPRFSVKVLYCLFQSFYCKIRSRYRYAFYLNA